MNNRLPGKFLLYAILLIFVSAVPGCNKTSELARDNPFDTDASREPVKWIRCFGYLLEFPHDLDISQLAVWPNGSPENIFGSTVDLWNQNGLVLGVCQTDSWPTLWSGLQAAGGKPLGKYCGIVGNRHDVTEFQIRWIEDETSIFVTDGQSRQPRGYTLVQGQFFVRLNFVPLNLGQANQQISLGVVPLFRESKKRYRLIQGETGDLRPVLEKRNIFFEQLVLNGTVDNKAIICIAPRHHAENPGTLGRYLLSDEQKSPKTQFVLLLKPEIFTAYKGKRNVD